MTIFSLLKQEHRSVNKLFADLESLDRTATLERQLTFTELKQELLAHAKAEHVSLYDRLIDEPATHEVVVRSHHEHQRIEQLLSDMSHVATDSEEFGQWLVLLKTHVNRHVQEEENVIFPRAKAILEKVEQKEIALDFQDRKYALLNTFA